MNTSFTFRIFQDGYGGFTKSNFDCPWAKDPTQKQWAFDRALAAFHVYVHLEEFHSAVQALELSEEVKGWSSDRTTTIRHKKHILKEYLDSQASEAFTPLGEEFYRTLTTAVAARR